MEFLADERREVTIVIRHCKYGAEMLEGDGDGG